MATPISNDELKSQLDAANERYAKNPVRSASEVAMGNTSPNLTPEELAAIRAKVTPAAVQGVDLANAAANSPTANLNRTQLQYPLSDTARQYIANSPIPDVKEISGGLVTPAPAPSVVTENVNAMNDWRNTGLDENGNVLTPEQRIARHKAELDIAAGQKPNQVAVRNNEFTMPTEPDRTLATRPSGTITAEPVVEPDRTLALRNAGPLATIESTAQEALAGNRGLGAILRGAGNVGLKAVPLIGGLAAGYNDYKEGGDSVARGVVGGLGTTVGALGGGALGSLVSPVVGTAAGDVVGGYVGDRLATGIYDRYFGHPKVTAPTPVAAPVVAAPTDTRTNDEKFQDAINYQQAQAQLREQASIDRYNNFRQGVENNRAMEAAQNRAHTSDPIYNLQTAELLAKAATAKAGGDSNKAETYLPAQDSAYPSDTVAMAQQLLKNPDMPTAERISSMMATTPENQLARSSERYEKRASELAGLQSGTEFKADKLDLQERLADSKDAQRSMAQKYRDAGVNLKAAQLIGAQLKAYDKVVDKEHDPNYIKLKSEQDHLIRSAGVNLNGDDVETSDIPAAVASEDNTPQSKGVPKGAIDALIKNPKLKDQFESKYGKGSSNQYLAQK
jgi:hypothetical protein